MMEMIVWFLFGVGVALLVMAGGKLFANFRHWRI